MPVNAACVRRANAGGCSPLLWTVLLVLGIGGFIQQANDLGTSTSFLDNLYFTLQLAALSYEGDSEAINWRLQVARFVAPVIAASTLLQSASVVFREQFARFRARRARRHTIVCGLGPMGVRARRGPRRGRPPGRRDRARPVLAGRGDGDRSRHPGRSSAIRPTRRCCAPLAPTGPRQIVAASESDGVNAAITAAAAGSPAPRACHRCGAPSTSPTPSSPTCCARPSCRTPVDRGSSSSASTPTRRAPCSTSTSRQERPARRRSAPRRARSRQLRSQRRDRRSTRSRRRRHAAR